MQINMNLKGHKMFITIALICFAIAAILGITFVVKYSSSGSLSTPIALSHGLFGALGLINLIIAAAKGMTSTVGNIALVIFVIAAIGGFILITNHLKKGSLPKPLIAIHAAAAVIAFLLLIFGSLA